MSSAIIHSKFKKLPQGTLSLVRRCESEDCEGQCVCGPQDKVCHNNGSSCNDVTIGKRKQIINHTDIETQIRNHNFEWLMLKYEKKVVNLVKFMFARES